jgi:hypothetical protein
MTPVESYDTISKKIIPLMPLSGKKELSQHLSYWHKTCPYVAG